MATYEITVTREWDGSIDDNVVVNLVDYATGSQIRQIVLRDYIQDWSMNIAKETVVRALMAEANDLNLVAMSDEDDSRISRLIRRAREIDRKIARSLWKTMRQIRIERDTNYGKMSK